MFGSNRLRLPSPSFPNTSNNKQRLGTPTSIPSSNNLFPTRTTTTTPITTSTTNTLSSNSKQSSSSSSSSNSTTLISPPTLNRVRSISRPSPLVGFSSNNNAVIESNSGVGVVNNLVGSSSLLPISSMGETVSRGLLFRSPTNHGATSSVTSNAQLSHSPSFDFQHQGGSFSTPSNYQQQNL